MSINWVPLYGKTSVSDDIVRFHGESISGEGGSPGPGVGALLSDQRFGGGAIEATITFSRSATSEVCGFILFYQPLNQAFISAQLGGDFLCSAWSYADNRWHSHGGAGLGSLIEPGRAYRLNVLAQGSSVRFVLDGVEVLQATLPFPLPVGQAGLWFRGTNEIVVRDYTVSSSKPRAFVVMQFTPPYNELFQEVIRPTCEKVGLKAERADDTYGPGVIIQDIERQLLKAQVIIADITPKNANVYYEVGYAHALKKPTILIAESPAQLPFDVSPFRTLFYENTIPGKAKVEEGLRRHLEAILGRGLLTE